LFSTRGGFKPDVPVKFDDHGEFHLYQAEGAEGILKFVTRAHVFFIIGNSALLIIEVVSPCKYAI